MGRPQLGAAVRALIRDAAKKLPEFAHIRASRILVVAGEARRASRATIRALGRPLNRSSGRKSGLDAKRDRRPRVIVRGRHMLYVITLRPMFFRQSTPEARIETILHELFHISGRFDGTLHRARRHAMLPGRRFSALLGPLVQRYLAKMDPAIAAALNHHGEVLVRQWLEKPPVKRARRGRSRKVYTEAHLFLGPVRMISKRAKAKVRGRDGAT